MGLGPGSFRVAAIVAASATPRFDAEASRIFALIEPGPFQRRHEARASASDETLNPHAACLAF